MIKNRKEILRVFLATSLIIVGTAHFIKSEQFVRIVPPQLPYPYELVYISGFFEILGGVGLLIPLVSVTAAWGIVALFIAVFPANINQAVNSISLEGVPDHPWLYWARLPFQAVLITWAWWYTKKSPNSSRSRGIRG